jgi:7-carboxy-7-deazaguanine synthase
VALVLATVAAGEPEIFAALQGEGVSAGWPCAFVRLSRCNLACEWCDTAYTWHFAGDNRPHRDGMTFERTANQLTLPEADVAARIAALGKLRLVITGGEPLLQAPALARMIAHLPNMKIEVETNGTVMPAPALDALIDQYNVSPKLAHSGNPRDLALVPETLAWFAADPRAFFKFVIAEPGDVDEVHALAQGYSIPPSRILLMPEGRDSATIRARAIWLSDICSLHEFRYSDRLHIHLHGDTRGT